MKRRRRKSQPLFFREWSSTHQPPAQGTNARMMERRDWSSLPELMVAKISNVLLSEDVTEYIRFRAVCPGWRRSTAPPSNIESAFWPRNWILIISGHREKHYPRRLKDWSTFFNVSSGGCLLVDIPQFREGYTPIFSADGLLVLQKMDTGELCLLHPFALSATELPKMDSLLSIVPTKKWSIQGDLSSVNFLSSSIVIFFFQRHRKVVFTRIRGNRWIGTNYVVSSISAQSFQGKLYAADIITGDVLQFELEETTIGPSLDPKLNLTNRIPTFSYPLYHGLLESGGQMLLLCKCHDEPPLFGCHFKVYEIDVENTRLIPTTIPRDQTIFASETRCLSLSTSVSRSILPQSIYYYRSNCPDIIVYNSHHPILAPSNSYYPLPEIIYSYAMPYKKKLIGPYSLPSVLICHCANIMCR